MFPRIPNDRISRLWSWVLVLSILCCAGVARAQSEKSEQSSRQLAVVLDISHAYAFGLAWDSGVASSYLGGKNEVCGRSHYSIHALDLEPYNVFWEPLIRSRDMEYNIPKDVDHLKKFMEKDGGGVFFFCHIPAPADKTWENSNEFIKQFGFHHGPHAVGPLTLVEHEATKDAETPTFGGHTIVLHEPDKWTVLVKDSKDRPVLAVREVGKGRLVATGTNVIGGRKEGDRAPNYSLVHNLLVWCSAGKDVPPGAPGGEMGPEHVKKLGDITLHYNDYLAKYADEVAKWYKKLKPEMADWMGVPLVGTTGKEGSHTGHMDAWLLPCGDAAWSVGPKIGIAVFWGGFPEVPVDVIGVMGHELHHSWVRNYGTAFNGHEGYAIYAGCKMLDRLGFDDTWEKYTQNLDKRLADEEWKKIPWDKDPTTKYQVLLWHMEKNYGEEVNARYYKLREKYVREGGRAATGHDDAWFWSQASGEDQFAFMNSIGYDVDPAKVTVTKEGE